MGVSITGKAACSNSFPFSWGSVTGVDYARRSYNQGVVYRISVTEYCSELTLNVGIMATSTGYNATVSAYLYSTDPTTSGSKQPIGGYVSSKSLVARLSTSGNLNTEDRMTNFNFTGLNLSTGTYYIWICETAGSPYEIHVYTGGGGYNLDPVNITGSFSPDPPFPTVNEIRLYTTEGIASVSGAGYYNYYDLATISAEVLPGYAFDAWYDYDTFRLVTRNNPYQLRVTGLYKFQARATFQGVPIQVTYDSDTIAGVTGAGTYTVGSTCTLTASLPAETSEYKYEFDRWDSQGATVSTNQTYSFRVPDVRNVLTYTAYGRKIKKSTGGVWIFSSGAFKHYKGNIRTGQSTIKVTPWIYHNSAWIKCK